MTTRNEHSPVSWEEVLLAIFPQEGLDSESIRSIVRVIGEARDNGQASDEQVEEVLKLLIASSARHEVNTMLSNFFTPSVRRLTDRHTEINSIRDMVVHRGRRPVRVI